VVVALLLSSGLHSHESKLRGGTEVAWGVVVAVVVVGCRNGGDGSR